MLDGIELSIAAGESVAIVGPSGSGKGTRIDRLDEDSLARMRRDRLGFVFQDFQLLPNLTARENVLLTLELAGSAQPEQRCDELLATVGLGRRGHHYPAQLSGGEQQRVALARAFAPRPRILLADEPTGNLDAETASGVLELLFGLHEQERRTLVVVTHDRDVAARADRCIALAGGRVVEPPAGLRRAEVAAP